MNKMLRGLVIIMILSVGCLPVTAQAQELEEDAVETIDEEEVFFAIGAVKEISSTQIRIIEDYDGDEEVVATFLINENTDFENFDAIGEIVVGDMIMIDYEETEAGDLAVSLIKVDEGDLEDLDAEGGA